MPELIKIKGIQIVIQNILSEFEKHSNSMKKLRDKHSYEVQVVNAKYTRDWQVDDCNQEQYNLRLKHNKENSSEKESLNKELQNLSRNLKEFINCDAQLMELLPKLSFIETSALLFVLDADQQAIALTHLNKQDNTAIIAANEYKQLKTLKPYNPSQHPENNALWQSFCSNKLAPYEQREADKRKKEQEAQIARRQQQIKANQEAEKTKFDQRVQDETTLKNKLDQMMDQVKGKEWRASGVPSFFRNYSGQYRPLQQWRPKTIVMIEKLLGEESKKTKGYTNYSRVKEKMIQALENVTKQPHSFWNSLVIGRSEDTIQEYKTILQSLKNKAASL